jgi:hypothetical protein
VSIISAMRKEPERPERRITFEISEGKARTLVAALSIAIERLERGPTVGELKYLRETIRRAVDGN